MENIDVGDKNRSISTELRKTKFREQVTYRTLIVKQIN